MNITESPLFERMIFNVGARRSGTFWLQRIVTAHPDVAEIPSETSLFSHGIAPLMDRFHHGARSSPQVGAIYAPRETLRDAVRLFADTMLAPYLTHGATHLAERTALHVDHVALIADIYPDARIVHIIRDGRDVARSVKAHPWGPNSIAGAAREWNDSIKTARAAELPPDRYREVRYEAMLASPESEIPALYEWLGLPVNALVLERALDEARAQKNVDEFAIPGVAHGKWRHAYTSKDLRDFQAVAGDLLAELGYEPAEAPPASLGADMAREIVRRARQRMTRGPRAQLASDGGPLDHVVLGDEVLGALLEGRFATLDEVMHPNVLVKIVAGDRVDVERGAAARELLAHTIGKDDVLAGRQVIGDVYPGKPTIGYVLRFEGANRTAGERVVFLTLRNAKVVEVALYAPPLGDGERPQAHGSSVRGA